VRSPLPRPPASGSVQVDVIAVGHGDSIVIGSSTGKHVLIDAGEAEAAPVILALLRSRQACPLDLVVVTHAHSDHMGGVGKVVEDCGTKLLMDSGFRHDTPIYLRLLETMQKHGIQLRQAEAGRTVELGGGAVLTLLGPPQPFLEGGSEGPNSNSVVTRLVLGKTSMLLVGDADFQEERWLLGRGVEMRSQVLKVGHHGSRTSSSSEFLHAVAPALAVVSNWPGAPKHPHPETVARIAEAGARMVETGREGTIHLELDGEHVSWQTAAHPQKVMLQ
jgi:competence protein ComEC